MPQEISWWDEGDFIPTSANSPGFVAFMQEKQKNLNKAVKKCLNKEEEMPVLTAKEGFMFGCDPEGFIKDSATGKHVSAEGIIPGTKEEPHRVQYGAVQVDGMAAEFNIDPVDNFKDFNRNIQAVINQLEKMLPKGLELDFVPAVTFDPEIFDASPDKAKELGCSPDFNAWTGDINPPPKDEANPYLRTASGHLHVSWPGGPFELDDLQHLMNCNDLVKQFDWVLAAWSLKLDPDPTRRRLYGKAGACRYKTYGVEYRTLSNFWITSRDRRLMVWNRMQLAINAMAQNVFPEKARAAFNSLLVESINTSKLDTTLVRNYPFPLVSVEAQVKMAA
jgi:hypothetical protein